MTMTSTDTRDLVIRIRELARTREHRIAARQLAALDTQSEASLLAMRTYLEGRPERAEGDAPVNIAAQVEQATAAGRLAAETGISPYAKAGGQPASRELHAGPVADSRPARRGGTRITEEGIYYYDGHVYKVIKSQYSGHWQARRLNPAVRRNRWTYAEGMMGVLRAEHKMTIADSREFEKLWGFPVCGDCGLPLENDLSRLRRIGPDCWVNNGHTDDEIQDEED